MSSLSVILIFTDFGLVLTKLSEIGILQWNSLSFMFSLILGTYFDVTVSFIPGGAAHGSFCWAVRSFFWASSCLALVMSCEAVAFNLAYSSAFFTFFVPSMHFLALPWRSWLCSDNCVIIYTNFYAFSSTLIPNKISHVIAFGTFSFYNFPVSLYPFAALLPFSHIAMSSTALVLFPRIFIWYWTPFLY